MPLARKCSRCETLYEDYHDGKGNNEPYNALLLLNVYLNDHYDSKDTLDLCPKCKRSFTRWLDNKYEHCDQEKSVKEPYCIRDDGK